jgi:hypothetical protein
VEMFSNPCVNYFKCVSLSDDVLSRIYGVKGILMSMNLKYWCSNNWRVIIDLA